MKLLIVSFSLTSGRTILAKDIARQSIAGRYPKIHEVRVQYVTDKTRLTFSMSNYFI